VDKANPYNLIPFLEASLSGRNVHFWYDLNLEAGTKYQAEIEGQVDAADIAILLVSQHFLNSDFIRKIELSRIMARAERGELLILPILVEHCDWEEVDSLRSRQMLPGAPTPLIEFLGREADWSRVRFEILQALKKHLSHVPRKDQDRDSLTMKIHETARDIRAKVQGFPMTVYIFKNEMEPLVRRMASDPQLEREAGRSAAELYRLYAAAILLAPAAGDVRELAKQALPWLRRALAVRPGFGDAVELGSAEAFLGGLLLPLRREILMKPLLKNEFRLAMIEAADTEVEAIAEKAVVMIGEIIKQREGPGPAKAQEPRPAQNVAEDSSRQEVSRDQAHPSLEEPMSTAFGLSLEKKAALKLGFVLGSNLALIALPPQIRTMSFAGLPFGLNDSGGFLDALGFSPGERDRIVAGVGSAMAETNAMRASQNLFQEINRIKDALNASSGQGLMATYRIGFTLGHTLEFASILTKNQAQASQVATFETVTQKYKSALPSDIPRAGLPPALLEAVNRASLPAKSTADLAVVIAACREVLAAAGD
jgi:hypothetical protein